MQQIVVGSVLVLAVFLTTSIAANRSKAIDAHEQTQEPRLSTCANMSISFGGIKAVDDVSLDLYPGEVVGLLGHNGAGKSTLIKMLSGAYQKDSGEIWIDGKKADIRTPRDSRTTISRRSTRRWRWPIILMRQSNLFLGPRTDHAAWLCR